MPLAGLTFLFLFLPASLLLHHLLPRPLKGPVMLLCGLVFYAWGDLTNLPLLVLLALLAYLTARQTGREQDSAVRKGITGLGIGLTLVFLILFKFGVELFSAVPVGGKLFTLGMDVPLGLSFFVLRMIGYQVDVYRGEGKQASSFYEFLCYSLFFPLITPGPLLSFSQWRERGEQKGGAGLFIWGLAQKLLFADTASALFHRLVDVDLSELPVVTAWLAVYVGFFAFYFELAAYLHMGAGLCRLFGVLADPLCSGPFSGGSMGRNLQGFHGHLFMWVEKYIYLPFKEAGLTHPAAILFSGMLTGLLFGARIPSLLFGFFAGVVLLLEPSRKQLQEKGITAMVRLISLVLLPLGVSLLSFQRVVDWGGFAGALFGLADNVFADSYSLTLLGTALPFLAVCALSSSELVGRFFRWLPVRFQVLRRGFMGTVLLLLFCLCVFFLVENGSSSFVYFQL